MSGIFTAKATATKARCARCGLLFTPKKVGDKYGPICARKLAGQVQLDSQMLVSGKVLRRESHAELVERCRREMTSDLSDSP
jgi:hypothetical protein